MNGEKNIKMDLKILNIMKYLLPILLLVTLLYSKLSITSDLKIDSKVLYLLSIILIIFSIFLNMIITKLNRTYILRFINAIIVFIYMLLITSGVAVFTLPLLFITHILLICVYISKSKIREKITQKMNSKVMNKFLKLVTLFSVFIIPFADLSINFLFVLIYMGMIFTEIGFLDIINLNIDYLKKYKLTKYY